MFAGGTALLGMLVVERADLTVRSTAHVRNALGAPVLGMLVRRTSPGMRASDVAAVMRSTQSARDGAAHLTVVDVDDGTLAAAVADTLRASFAEAARDQQTSDAIAAPCVQVLEPLTSYGAAAAASRRGRVIMAVEVGRTRRDALERAAALLAETQADVAGAVVVSARTVDAAEAWS
jgi:hypothetical protein